ncbi:hypothetical protein AMS68_007322 [Peltaster fructicola]|uniref:Uncharacterized protein n=1 Tax=Peltaster fructicola TaxID=286661 RepID=A0A6H0Y4F2_9PEZI|nr:hypothetical protein AMS68_007322 [Peltaster fructicola]
MAPYDPQQGWGTRYPLEIIARTVIAHGVMVANYMHLQRVQKIQHSSRTAQMLRFVLFAFMPTLIVAELILDLSRVVLLFLQPDFRKLSLREKLAGWRRYLCAVAGMHVIPCSEQGVELDEVHEGLLENDADNESQLSTAVTEHQTARLSKIQDLKDVQQHTQPFDLQIMVHILLLMLPILQTAGTILLFNRRLANIIRLRWPLELDKRNLVAAVASSLCSIPASLIVLCRSEWSLKTSNTQKPRRRDYVVRTLFLEITIASILNEAPFVEVWDVVPTSWIVIIARFLGLIGMVVVLCIGLAATVAVWIYGEKLKQRMKINWDLVLGLPMAIITTWITVDLIWYFVFDIVQLSSFTPIDSMFDKDPIANYLPFCA